MRVHLLPMSTLRSSHPSKLVKAAHHLNPAAHPLLCVIYSQLLSISLALAQAMDVLSDTVWSPVQFERPTQASFPPPGSLQPIPRRARHSLPVLWSHSILPLCFVGITINIKWVDLGHGGLTFWWFKQSENSDNSENVEMVWLELEVSVSLQFYTSLIKMKNRNHPTRIGSNTIVIFSFPCLRTFFIPFSCLQCNIFTTSSCALFPLALGYSRARDFLNLHPQWGSMWAKQWLRINKTETMISLLWFLKERGLICLNVHSASEAYLITMGHTVSENNQSFGHFSVGLWF